MENHFFSSESAFLLWANWQTTDKLSYAVLLILVFFLALANEWLAVARIKYMDLLTRKSLPTANATESESPTTTLVIGDMAPWQRFAAHAAATAMYLSSTVLALLLMLLVMSFNGGIFVAVLCGTAAGHFFFGSSWAPWSSMWQTNVAGVSCAVYLWFSYGYFFLARRVALGEGGMDHHGKHSGDVGAMHGDTKQILNIFNWHPILMITSVVMLMAAGLLSHRFRLPRHLRVTVHGTLMLGALLSAWAGFGVVWKYMDDAAEADGEKASHMAHAHAWTGMATLVLMALMSALGFGMQFVSTHQMLTVRALHRAGGILTFTVAVYCIGLGFQFDQLHYALFGECGENCAARNWDTALGTLALIPLLTVLAALTKLTVLGSSLTERQIIPVAHRMKQEFEVQMSCQACVDQISAALSSLSGIEAVECFLPSERVTIVGLVSSDDVLKSMEAIGRVATFISAAPA